MRIESLLFFFAIVMGFAAVPALIAFSVFRLTRSEDASNTSNIRALWGAFKLLLSLCLIVLACMAVLSAVKPPPHHALFALAGVFIFLAALPWVDFQRNSRSLGWVCVVMSFGFGYFASQILNDEVVFPRECLGRGRGTAICMLENILHAIGGNSLAAAPFLLGAFAFFLGGLGITFRAHRQDRRAEKRSAFRRM